MKSPYGTDVSHPLSPFQRSIWFLNRANPGEVSYNIAWTVDIPTSIDPAIFNTSIKLVLDRHEPLRTRYSLDPKGMPVQTVGPPRFEWTFHDLTAQIEAETLVRNLATQVAKRPFDLENGPVLRVNLFKLGENQFYCSFCVHHIAFDGASISILGNELDTAYRSMLEGKSLWKDPLRQSYGQYSIEASDSLESHEGLKSRAYWSNLLSDFDTPVEFPVDRLRVGELELTGDVVRIPVEPSLAAKIKEHARAASVSPFMLCLAGFLSFVGRLTGQDDLVVGVPVSSRSTVSSQELIGMFVSSLPIRSRICPTDEFSTYLQQVREIVLEALAHQNVPLSVIMEDVSRSNGSIQGALFRNLFAVDTTRTSFGGNLIRSTIIEEVDNGSAKFDTSWTLILDDEAPTLVIEFCSFFERSTIHQLSQSFLSFLRSAVTRPRTRIVDLAVVSDQAPSTTISGSSTLFTVDSHNSTLNNILARSVEDAKDDIAITYDNENTSYASFWFRYTEIRNILASKGFRPGDIVAVLCERSTELIVALHGIVHAGLTYLPLDPAQPDDRLRYILRDAQPRLTIVHKNQLHRIADEATDLLVIDDWTDRAATPTGSVPITGRAACPLDSVYLIYTSGSTGRPKGVINTHAGIVNRLLWMQRELGLTKNDVFLQKTPAGFDVSVWEIFLPALVGARMVVASPTGHRDAAYMRDLIFSEKVTTVHFVPSMLAAFIESPSVSGCLSITRIICSGEELPAALARRVFEILPQVRLFNLYGPTEAAVDVTFYECTADKVAVLTRIPIGVPVSNTTVQILDAVGREVFDGIPGELYLGGVQLARGYVGNPSLTADKFVPTSGGSRLYATGDLCRLDASGNVIYLGRLDDQVKIRGQRVELGEIESVLRSELGVRDVAVVLSSHNSQLDSMILVAYIVGELNESAVKRRISRLLPRHMVPDIFMQIQEMPLSVNGKLDRRALPAAKREPTAVQSDRNEPMDQLEAALTDLWAEYSGVHSIAVDDDFFAAGGNSIQSIQLLTQLHRKFGVEISVNELFECGTPRAIAELLRMDNRQSEFGTNGSAVKVAELGNVATTKHRKICFIHSVGGGIGSYASLAPTLPEYGVYAIASAEIASSAASANEDWASLPTSIPEMASQYCDQLGDGEWILAGWSMGGVIAMEMAKELRSRSRAVRGVLLIDSIAPEYLTEEPQFPESKLVAMFASDLGKTIGTELDVAEDDLVNLSLEEMLRQLTSAALRTGIISEKSESVVLINRFRAFARNLRALYSHVLTGQFEETVELFRAEKTRFRDSSLGWRSYANGPFHTTDVPGDHYSIFNTDRTALVSALRDRLSFLE